MMESIKLTHKEGIELLKEGKLIDELPHGLVSILYEFHFDVFGLIENGLAIDINTLNN